MEAILVPMKDAAKALCISRVTLYKHVNSGLIETVVLGGRRLVKAESLRRVAGVDKVAA